MDFKLMLREYLIREMYEQGFTGEIGYDTPLVEHGILDSLAILTLIDFLDTEFNIVPDENELYPENFESIEIINKFIIKKLKNSRYL